MCPDSSQTGSARTSIGQILDLLEAQLLTLVQVDGTGQGELVQDRRPGTPLAETEIGRADRIGENVGGRFTTLRLGAPEPADVAEDVVVAEHPRHRRADHRRRGHRCRRGRDEGVRPPRRADHVEVERGVQLVRPKIRSETLGCRHPGLGDEDAWRVEAVGHLAPLSVHVVDPRPIPERVVETVGDDWCVVLGKVEIRQGGILDETVGDIDPEAVDAAFEPEPEDVEELVANLAVVPVEVGLLDGEQVEVPLPRRSVGLRDPLPGRSAERRFPVVRRQISIRAASRPEDVAGALA